MFRWQIIDEYKLFKISKNRCYTDLRVDWWWVNYEPETKTRLSAGCCANTASLFCIGNYYLVANFSRIRADLPERSRK
ncbi:hypothetical protein GCM10009409_04150 [Shewanella saliphila]|uniref:Uncharacterized protein n=1 Tax=Shewanella saliphila TaxID=2282698 RepID=A0ABQ2Q1K2_9GAMM|nr:hypothetical protein GCM10009409_04150 [Shewanella saliphila]